MSNKRRGFHLDAVYDEIYGTGRRRKAELSRVLTDPAPNAAGESWSSSFLKDHTSCVNTVNFSHGEGQFLVSAGDDLTTRIWAVNSPTPWAQRKPVRKLKGGHQLNIFTAAFTSDNAQVYTCGHEGHMCCYNVETGDFDVYEHPYSIPRLVISPADDNNVLTVCNKIVTRWDTRIGKRSGYFKSTEIINSVDINRASPHIFVMSGTDGTLQLMDDRVSFLQGVDVVDKKPLFVYNTAPLIPGNADAVDVMSAQFSRSGQQLVVLTRFGLPWMYDVQGRNPSKVFPSSTFENSCTMKSAIFGGVDDELVLCGSDDFTIYGWSTRTTAAAQETHFSFQTCPQEVTVQRVAPCLRLSGTRSIPNNLASHPTLPLLASSGVEKLVRVWSPFALSDKEFGRDVLPQRERNRGVDDDGEVRLPLSSDDSNNESEDPGTLRMFDLYRGQAVLERRHELEGLNSEDLAAANELFGDLIDSSSDDDDDDDNDDEDDDEEDEEEAVRPRRNSNVSRGSSDIPLERRRRGSSGEAHRRGESEDLSQARDRAFRRPSRNSSDDDEHFPEPRPAAAADDDDDDDDGSGGESSDGNGSSGREYW